MERDLIQTNHHQFVIKRKAAPTIDTIPINLGDPLPSDVTPESLEAILKQILLENEGSIPGNSQGDKTNQTQADGSAKRRTEGGTTSNPTETLAGAVARLLLENRATESPNMPT